MRQDASGLALLGPLVVKLRGAPSHPIPNPLTFEELSGGAEARVSQNGTFHHRILLSSLDFARQVSLGESLPECIRDLLREEDRVVCFLGHALDDPDSLLGLQAHVWVSSSPDGWRPISPHEVSQQPTGKSTEEVPRTEGKECGVGVECTRADGFEQEFLSGLGIRSLPMRLSEVASEIQKVPGLANFECEVAKDGI
jgi:hypothetical protein